MPVCRANRLWRHNLRNHSGWNVQHLLRVRRRRWLVTALGVDSGNQWQLLWNIAIWPIGLRRDLRGQPKRNTDFTLQLYQWQRRIGTARTAGASRGWKLLRNDERSRSLRLWHSFWNEPDWHFAYTA